MSQRFRSAAFGLSICLLPAACSDQTAGIEPDLATQNAGEDCEAADLVIHNTTIYTANDNQWTASALAVLGTALYMSAMNPASSPTCAAMPDFRSDRADGIRRLH